MTEGQIFSRPARPDSVNKHFIIWPPRFSFHSFLSFLFSFFRPPFVLFRAHFQRPMISRHLFGKPVKCIWTVQTATYRIVQCVLSGIIYNQKFFLFFFLFFIFFKQFYLQDKNTYTTYNKIILTYIYNYIARLILTLFIQANRTNTYATYNTNIILTFTFTLHCSYLRCLYQH